MGGGRGKKGKKKSTTGKGMGPRGKLGPKGTVTKAQQAAKNRIAKKAVATKAASMGATNKSFTSGLPSYSSLTSKTEAKKTFGPKASKGPSFKQSVKMATTPTPAPKVESSKDVASHDKPLFKSVPARLDQPASPKFIEGMLQKNINPSTPGDLYGVGQKLAGGYGLLPSGEHGPYKEGTVSISAEGSPSFEKKYRYSEKQGWQPFTEKADAGLGIKKSILTAFNPVAGLGALFGGAPVNAATVDSKYSPSMPGLAKSLGFDTTTGTYNAPPGSTGLVGVTGGGLNIGGAGFNQSDGGSGVSRAIFSGKNPVTSDQPASSFNFGPTIDRFGRGDEYARNLNEFGMRFGETPEARADAYDRSLTGRKNLFDGQTVGSGPVASGDAYARGLQTSRFGSPLNAVKTGLNFMGANLRLQNDKELADSVGRAPTLTRPRRRGGSRLAAVQPQQPLTPEEILEPQQVAPTQSGPAYQQAGMDNSRLMQIQNDAYSRQMSQIYNPMEVGGFSPLFRFFGRRGGPRRGAFRKAFRRN